jgi:hypothetical protein
MASNPNADIDLTASRRWQFISSALPNFSRAKLFSPSSRASRRLPSPQALSRGSHLEREREPVRHNACPWIKTISEEMPKPCPPKSSVQPAHQPPGIRTQIPRSWEAVPEPSMGNAIADRRRARSLVCLSRLDGWHVRPSPQLPSFRRPVDGDFLNPHSPPTTAQPLTESWPIDIGSETAARLPGK